MLVIAFAACAVHADPPVFPGGDNDPASPAPTYRTSPFPAAAPSLPDAAGDAGLPAGILDSRYHREAKPAWENLSVLGGLDGSKGPEDLGVSANFGVRGAVQTGMPLVEDWGLGLQVGTGVNYERTATRFMHVLLDTNQRTQSFTTIGLFQRTESGWNWGVVYDFLYDHYYVDMTLGQLRGQAGYWFDPQNEMGLWGTLRAQSERLIISQDNLALEPIDQLNLYWRHIWPTNVVTRGWVGLAEGHGRYILIGPTSPAVHHPLVFGADVFIPLTGSLAIFGEANFITPNDSGTVTALFGLVYYPAGTAGDAFRNRFAPLLPTGNNPTFGVNVQP